MTARALPIVLVLSTVLAGAACDHPMAPGGPAPLGYGDSRAPEKLQGQIHLTVAGPKEVAPLVEAWEMRYRGKQKTAQLGYEVIDPSALSARALTRSSAIVIAPGETTPPANAPEPMVSIKLAGSGPGGAPHALMYVETADAGGAQAAAKWLNWVLTDGQAVAQQVGYQPLSEAERADSLKKLSTLSGGGQPALATK